MQRSEKLASPPSLFPLGRVAPLRALTEMSPRAISADVKRIQGIINEELESMKGIDGKTGENPEAKTYIDLMSKYLDIGNGLSVPALRVGMITMYHTARLRGDAVGTDIPKITPNQLKTYFIEKDLDIKDGSLGGTVLNFYPWNKVLTNFQYEEPYFQKQLNKIGKSSDPQYVSWEFGSALMWDFLKTAPAL